MCNSLSCLGIHRLSLFLITPLPKKKSEQPFPLALSLPLSSITALSLLPEIHPFPSSSLSF